MAMQRQDCLDVNTVNPVSIDGSHPPGLMARTLAVEGATGGLHMVLEIPAGCRAPRGYNGASLDIYVLSGSIKLGNELLTTGCYTYLPAGMAYGPLASEAGARILLFSDRPYRFVASEDSLTDTIAERHIPRVETWRLPWVDPMKDIVKKSTWVDPRTGKEGRPAGVLTKSLRKDDGTKEVVALTVLSPGFVDPGTEHHPHNECLYLISGDAYIGLTYDHRREDVKENLVLRKDFYIGRPPGIRHGPVCTQNGALWLIYLADHYTGIYKEVPDWEARVSRYLASENFR